MSDTPLSDAITRLGADPAGAAYTAFIETFLDAKVGVIADNLPSNRRPGERFQIGPNDCVKLALVGTPDGGRMVKACADPVVFAARYPDEQKITALMLGRDLLHMVAQSSELDGVLVCSARSFHSVPIGRSEAARLVEQSEARVRPARPWWKLWGS